MSKPTKKRIVIVNGEKQKHLAKTKRATPEERAAIERMLAAKVAPKLPG